MNTANKTLEEYQQALRECVKCGTCQAHCPTYLACKKESAVARAKNALASAVLDQAVELDGDLQRAIDICLMCGSCVHTCPNKVPTHEIVGAVRRKLTEKRGMSGIGKIVGSITGSPRALAIFGKTGNLLSHLLTTKIPETSGLQLRFPLADMRDRTFPSLPYQNLFDLVPEWTQGQPDKPVVSFFAGCGITYVYPQIGISMVNILQHLGFSVYFPHTQKCCGIPALSIGNGTLNEELAKANIAAFAQHQAEYIITACASCNSGIGEHYQTMGLPESFTGKVIDFSVFLDEIGIIEQIAQHPSWPNRRTVTYHDPCHLKNQGITKEPRTLLKSLPNIEYVEMDKANACCGLGGSFSVKNYPMSKKIGEMKVAGLQKSKAELVATSCPGCIIQLQDIINHAGLNMKAVHILDLLAEAFAPSSTRS